MKPLGLRSVKKSVALLCIFFCAIANAEISVIDDSGRRVTLTSPAKRIVSLAPHVTELLFVAGTGNKVIGVSSGSDYPSEASQLPSTGNSSRLDIERITLLKPDLIIAWTSGNNPRQIVQLRQQGYAVFESEPRRFEDIATTLERLATLTGSTSGSNAADEFRRSLALLGDRYQRRTPVTVFYQIWPSPLMTLNGQHLVSQALNLCGATNVFGGLPQLAPTVSREAVASANPDAILISDDSGGIERWTNLTSLKAVRQQHILKVNGKLLNRPTPRMLTAISDLCEQIDTVRRHKQPTSP
jgi:iron complex transport system substrate-binding protein